MGNVLLAILPVSIAGIVSGLISWGVVRSKLDKVDKLDCQINGNGQEGIVCKVARIEANIGNIKEDIHEIKEAVKK